MLTRAIRALLTLTLFAVPVAQADTTAAGLAAAPGYGELGYELPIIGSYQLPSLGYAHDGEVLDTQGLQQRLYDLFDNKYVLLAFIYSTCSDVNGCPLTSHVFYKIKSAMKHDSALAERLKLISLSFDPSVDTPEVMKLYSNNFRYAGNAGEWQFVTTDSEQTLDPILKAYNQDVQRLATSDGRYDAGYSHVLRVFLIDPEKEIRNIYSVAFLHQDLILNDVKTLFEQGVNAKHATGLMPVSQTALLSTPGDDKRGYESASYTTNARALELRQGKEADLMQFIDSPPLGLPSVPIPVDNPVTREKIALGRKLFFDRRLSLNDTFSCAMCHVPEQGFTSNELSMAVGIEGRSVRRNSPTIYNTAYASLLFHDGREDTLEQQAWGPLLAKNEMGNPSIGHVLNKIRGIPEYQGLFETAFDGRGVTMETLGMALACYERSLASANSNFDRWYYAKDTQALSSSAQRGFELFTGKGGCSACHTIGAEYALFTDNQLHNTGTGYRESMGIRPEKQQIVVAPGVTLEVERSVIDRVGEKPPTDVGRYEVTENPHDRWKYKTPSLRNVSLTAPYMHNGSLSTLLDVVEFYDQGGVPNELLDPQIRPLHLSQQEKQDLVSFIKSLTGSNVDTIVADAFSAPIGDIKKGDPSWVHGTDVEVR
ncbi:MAG: SCO family protein [Candidatus Thiodiazotropha sp. (ex Lucinoma borealis)]|nr:SCO family protein [Candidatus Thiodiazotropha sp. (ex Lucinoma borealis)]MCU7864041.1 SCO family protein [Candidatus Thiodiazotropha sp. (ex Lucinoma borealis)]